MSENVTKTAEEIVAAAEAEIARLSAERAKLEAESDVLHEKRRAISRQLDVERARITALKQISANPQILQALGIESAEAFGRLGG